MTEKAKLLLPGGASVELPTFVGTENEPAIDIGKLRAQTGYVTLDPAFVNTASTTSTVTYIDGEQGILRYRGIPIEELAEKSNFVEVSYLLMYGKLPTRPEMDRFGTLLTRHSMIHEDMKRFFDGYPMTAHPMAILSSMVSSLSSYYPDALDPMNLAVRDLTMIRLLSKVRTIAAFAFKKSIGQPFMYPRNDLEYCANFLYMMFSVPAEPYPLDDELVHVMNLLFILHADHEQNCSTSTVRMVGSSQASLFAAIAAGILALWGPLHGGANQEVIAMLEQIQADGGDVGKYVRLAKDKSSGFRLMGFGHRVYKNYDPRARILKKACDSVLAKLGKREDKLLDVARKLEEVALKDEYFIERKLYPNVDFYSGIIYRALGFPTDMFTVLFALGRIPGWIAHWREMIESSETKIARPRQIYTGRTLNAYVPMDQRT